MRRSLVGVSALILASSVGCGGRGAANRSHSRPVLETNAAVFDSLAHYPKSVPLGSRSTNPNGVVVQTFEVNSATPKQIVTWFGQALARKRWVAVGTPVAEGTKAYRGVWKHGTLQLVVASAPAPSIEAHSANNAGASQYSLLLYPPGTSLSP